MKAQEWLEAYAAEIGAEAPDEETIGELLELAATAAHSSERIAAPIACFMAGRDGRPPAELRAAADRVAEARLSLRVAELWRYSVKSLRGERLERVDVLADGLRGDRSTQVVDHKGARMTGRTAKRLLGLQSGTRREAASRRSTATRGEATRRSTSSATPPGRAQIWRRSGVTSTTARSWSRPTERSRRLASTGAACGPNIVIEGVEGLAEAEWVGRRLRLGGVELDVVDRCVRCVMTTIDPDSLDVDPNVLRRINEEFDTRMGVLCEVVTAGELCVGDDVELV